MSVDLFNSHGTVVFAVEPECQNKNEYWRNNRLLHAKLIIDLVSNKDVTLNGKFLNLNKEEIM